MPLACGPAKLLNACTFPVYKPAGVYASTLGRWIKLTLKHEMNIDYDLSLHKIRLRGLLIKVRPSLLDPTVSGVTLCGMGKSDSLGKLSMYWDHHFLVKCTLGLRTESFTCDGTVVHRKPSGDVTAQTLSQACQSMVGTFDFTQVPKWIWVNEEKRKYKLEQMEDDDEDDPDLDEFMNSPHIYKQQLLLNFDCSQFELVKFEPPNFTVKITTHTPMAIRAAIDELGLRVNNYAAVEESQLIRFGPFNIEDCLKPYELHVRNMAEACVKYTDLAQNELKKFVDLKRDYNKSYRIK